MFKSIIKVLLFWPGFYSFCGELWAMGWALCMYTMKSAYVNIQYVDNFWTGSSGFAVNAEPELAQRGRQIINYSAPADRDNHLVSVWTVDEMACYPRL